MRYGSVCSGIEAATAAWHPIGWKPSFFSEIEAFPRAVLEYHYPDVPLHGDFTTIQDGDYEPIDLLVGGTPCQSFSVAGLRKGLDDPRGNLMLGFGALAKRLRPTWLVWENVPGVLSANGGRDFGTFLGMLGELGYGFAYRVLDAQYFGLAQRRRRVFVVGYLGDWRAPAAVLFERHSLQGHPAPSREAGEETAGTLSSRTSGGGGPGTDFECAGGLQPVPILEPGARTGKSTTDPRAGSGIGRSGEPMFTLQAGKQHGVAATLDASYARLQGCSGQDTNHGHSHLVPVAYGQNRQSGPVHVSHALSAHAGPAGRLDFESETFLVQSIHGGRENAVFTRPIAWSEELTAHRELAGTITRGGSGGRHDGVMQRDMAVRRLTPVECERLQGFPEQEKSIDLTIYNGAIVSCTDHPRNYVNAATKCRKLQNSAQRVEESSFPLSVKSVVKGFCVGQASPKEHAVVNVEINYVAGTLLIHKYPSELMFSAKIAESSKENRKATPTGDFAQLSAEAISCVEQILRDGKAVSQKGTCSFTKAKSGKPQKEKRESDSREGARDATSEKCLASEVITLTTSQNTSTIRTSDLNLKILLSCVCHAIDGFTPNLIPKTSSCTIRLTVTDGFTKIPYRNKPADQCPDGPRYKALGNSMAVPVMHWIGNRIQKVETVLAEQKERAA